MQPQVSVVIPAYNSAKLLADTLESAVAQEGVALEVLVVDDGSTDDTARVAEEFGAPVRCLRQENQGPAQARNTGIRAARGEFIAFLDADDLWKPGKLRRQVDLLEQQPECALVFTGKETRNADLSQVLGTYLPRPEHRGDAFPALLEECFIQTSSVMVRRTVLERVGLFNTTLFGPEDWDLFARILHDHRVEAIPEPLLIYRKHEGSLQLNLERWVTNDLLAMNAIAALPRTRENRSFLSDQYSRIYSEAGIAYYYRGVYPLARKHLLSSLRYPKARLQSAAYLVKTLIPPALAERRRASRPAKIAA